MRPYQIWKLYLQVSHGRHGAKREPSQEGRHHGEAAELLAEALLPVDALRAHRHAARPAYLHRWASKPPNKPGRVPLTDGAGGGGSPGDGSPAAVRSLSRVSIVHGGKSTSFSLANRESLEMSAWKSAKRLQQFVVDSASHSSDSSGIEGAKPTQLATV